MTTTPQEPEDSLELEGSFDWFYDQLTRDNITLKEDLFWDGSYSREQPE